ncbi:hypothetical protein Mcup_0189 [Metallosphaera cuprina Ar-4]|uniref:Uncharacterized protein n=1 Tax=Metallosphaera cuprina (strain Ar-4) TaxID=1006006 RepID=F4FYQ9_METCR|nr:hypothetical protein Mcup_0189 [Metallosphaera cuprina Ar-4]
MVIVSLILIFKGDRVEDLLYIPSLYFIIKISRIIKSSFLSKV